MKSYQLILLFLVSLFVFSCTDNLANIGSNIQPSSDQIKIGTDTFHLTTENIFVDYITSRPDSFLLGNFYDAKFGSTQADILAQVNCPIGYIYPPSSVPDSAVVVMYYKTWVGDKYAPLDVNIYQMNLSTFSYSSLYPTNLDPTVYTDRSIKLGERIFSAKDAVAMRADSTAIRFKLSSDFVKTFINNSPYYSNPTNFLNEFKGIYITANYGAATLLNISQIDLSYFFHYTYTTKNVSGGDSTVIVKNYIVFPANSEVRQVNRFLHPDRAKVVQQVDSINYVASPANLQTRVNVPLMRIKQHMDAGVNGKKVTVNSALMKVEVTQTEQDTVLHPVVTYMLLIKESSMNRFFNNNELPSDTCAIYAQYNSVQIGTTGVYQQYYTFSIAKLIANELKNDGANPPEKLALRLVPVKITFNTSGTITKIKQSYLMSAVTLRSGINTYSPMRINVVYSGF
ncbi:MAG: DUF4270 domain-containing protein [Paludibacter sp.]|nr:DUF4270 domain-containing protein [Paludibacter sp.]